MDGSPTAPKAPERPDEELAEYTRAERLSRILGLHDVYLDLLWQDFAKLMPTFEAAARNADPKDTETVESGRNSILLICGFQVWENVLLDRRAFDVLINYMFVFIGLGVLAEGTAYWASGNSVPWTLVLLVIATVSAVLVAIGGLVVGEAIMSWVRLRYRLPLTLLGLLVLAAVAVPLLRWPSVYGRALLGGVGLGLVALILYNLGRQLLGVVMASVYRHTWTAYTPDEIVQTLTIVRATLDEPNPPQSVRATAASSLQHAAMCVEDYLPKYLAVDPGLRSSAENRCLEMGAPIRALALECLMSTGPTIDDVRRKVEHNMIAAANADWAKWETGTPHHGESASPRRRWFRGIGRFVVGVLPITAVIVGATYAYRTDTASNLVDAQVFGPLLVATFGWATHVLTGLLAPREVGSHDSQGDSGSALKRFLPTKP